MLGNLGLFMLAALLIHAVMLLAACLFLGKRFDNPAARISAIATTFANCAFFGIPIIEAVMGDAASELIIYTTAYAMVMNPLGWTAGSAIISKSKKYISVKKLLPIVMELLNL
jgi:predicted permease